jgi:hypothetical protein
MASTILGVFSLIVSASAIYISIYQYLNSRKITLYDKRFKIYEELLLILSYPVRKGDISTEDIEKFNVFVNESEFLFNSSIKGYLDKIVDNAYEFQTAVTTLNNKSLEDNERMEAIAKRSELMRWFDNQHEASIEIFSKYFKI